MADKIKRDTIPQGVRFDVFRRDNFTCRYCGRSSPSIVLHCDHVHPRSKGGEDKLENFVTACTDCNFGKRAKEGVQAPASQTADGLIGFYGFTFEDGVVNYQFKVLRTNGPDAYLVQTFSWWFGEPYTVIELRADFLLSSSCELYADERVWKDAYENRHKRAWDRMMDRAEVVS